MARYLLIDGGRSGLRAAVVDGERLVSRVYGRGLSYNRGESSDGMSEALGEAVLQAAGSNKTFDSVVVGLAPIDSRAVATAVATHVRSLVATAEVVATEDVVIHYAGALGPHPGAVIAAGTGAKALAVAPDGSSAASGAWGYILGDDGSGYWIGRQALAVAYCDLDGRAREPAIRTAAEELYGPLDLLSQELYREENPAGTVARFAARVAQLARSGDPLAASIWSRAAAELARSTIAAIRAVICPGEPVDVRWAGGLFAAGELLTEPFRRVILDAWPTARVGPGRGGPLDGALLLARQEVPALESLVFRTR
jgi:N-acetylglucosamine kinase-like BadF-type ATPase